jgi:uncharacterized protein YdeI (YjbR/CyaY-like superfamily)
MIDLRNGLPVILFESQAAFEAWLASQPPDAKGAWLRFAKKNASFESLTKAEAIDAALCHGWIDGQLDKYDEQSWLIRFTPRKARSQWSQVNRARAEALIAEGRFLPSGLKQVDQARADGRWDKAYAPASKAQVPEDLQAALEASPAAATFFATLTGANRYAILYRIGAVKRPETRARKIADYVAMLERGETLHG